MEEEKVISYRLSWKVGIHKDIMNSIAGYRVDEVTIRQSIQIHCNIRQEAIDQWLDRKDRKSSTKLAENGVLAKTLLNCSFLFSPNFLYYSWEKRRISNQCVR